jgi:hypothetical protein
MNGERGFMAVCGEFEHTYLKAASSLDFEEMKYACTKEEMHTHHKLRHHD